MSHAPDAAPELVRLVAADGPDRRLAAPSTMTEMYLRHDPTHELPLIVQTVAGHVIARFAHAGDLAIFVSRDRKTLPGAFWRQIQKEA